MGKQKKKNLPSEKKSEPAETRMAVEMRMEMGRGRKMEVEGSLSIQQILMLHLYLYLYLSLSLCARTTIHICVCTPIRTSVDVSVVASTRIKSNKHKNACHKDTYVCVLST